MADIFQIKVEDTTYDIQDTVARNKTEIEDGMVSASSTFSSHKIINVLNEMAYIGNSSSGTSITVTDSADGYVQKIGIKGKSRTTKNLAYTQSYNTVVAHCYQRNTYTFSVEPAIGFTLRKNNNQGDMIAWTVDGAPITFTADEDYDLYFNPYSTNFTHYQLELGSTATEYEPYFDGIKSVGDDGLTVQTTGKNLLQFTAQTQTVNGVTFTADKAAGTITVNGTATANTSFVFSNELYPSTGEYIYTANVSSNNVSNWWVSLGAGNTTVCSMSGKSVNPQHYTRVTNESVYGYIYIANGVTLSNVIVKPMLCIESDYVTDHTIELYTHSSATLTTGLPYRGITDDIADSADNTKVTKMCAEVDLRDLTWELHTISSPTPATYWSSTDIENNIKPTASTSETPAWIISENYVPAAQTSFIEAINNIAVTANGELLVNTNNSATTPTGKLVFEIATPYDIPLTSAEKSALASLRTYDHITHVDATDEPEMTVGYLKNTENGRAIAQLEEKTTAIYIKPLLTEAEILAQIADRVYEGTDLTIKFASEILNYTDEWAWIKARITAGNFTGIHVCDYIPITCTNDVTLNAQIAGINTYKNYGDSAVGSHIDFICKELWPTLHPVNPVNFNNGTASQNCAWLSTDLYLYLNSLAGTVPSAAEVGGGEGTAVDYTEGGVYYYLPTQLKNVIIEKRFLLPTRYSASGLLTDDNSWTWKNIGKLWLPDECEVCGVPVWSGKGGYSIGGSGLQYPLFAGNMNRFKFRNGNRNHWWLISPCSGNSMVWCIIGSSGDCSFYGASISGIAAPVCFRVG